MTRSVDDNLRKILAEVCQVDETQIGDDSNMESMDRWDSLSHMSLIVAIEQEFGVKFSPEEMVQMTSFGEIRRVVAEKS